MSTPKVRLQFTVNESEVYTNFSHLIGMLLPTMQRLADDYSRAQTLLQYADADDTDLSPDNDKRVEDAYSVLESLRADLFEIDQRLEEVQLMISGYVEAKTAAATPVMEPAAVSEGTVNLRDELKIPGRSDVTYNE